MNRLLKDYIKATEALEEYLDIESFNYYANEIHKNSCFSISLNKESISWADSEEDFETEDCYDSDIILLKESEDLIAVLINSDTGAGKYWLIFDNKNRI